MIDHRELERRIAARLAPFVDDALGRQPEATRALIEAQGAGLALRLCPAPEDPGRFAAAVLACVMVNGEHYPFCWVDSRNVGIFLSGDAGRLSAHYLPDPITDDDLPATPIEIAPGHWSWA